MTKIICPEGELFSIPQLKGKTIEYLSYVNQAGAEYVQNGSISTETKEKLSTLLYPPERFIEMANASWEINEPRTDKIQDNADRFMKQMAATYNQKSLMDQKIIIEMYFADLDKTYQLHLDQDKCSLKIDDFANYTTRIETSFAIWLEISEGKINGAEAMMKKQYKVLGDFNTMLKMDDYFGTKRTNITDPKPDNRKTNMSLLLFPWILMWILLPINQTWGSIAGIISCAVIPLLAEKWKLTKYENISILVVSVLGVLGLLQVNSIILVCSSYLLFGLIWLLSCFTKIPLTAYYSSNDYNGDEAMQNPLFIKTNAILTVDWGFIYILTTIWTFFLLSTPVAIYIGLINSVVPALMGVFTAWFAKWYPAKVARG